MPIIKKYYPKGLEWTHDYHDTPIILGSIAVWTLNTHKWQLFWLVCPLSSRRLTCLLYIPVSYQTEVSSFSYVGCVPCLLLWGLLVVVTFLAIYTTTSDNVHKMWILTKIHRFFSPKHQHFTLQNNHTRLLYQNWKTTCTGTTHTYLWLYSMEDIKISKNNTECLAVLLLNKLP